jgi:hypothetical protein
MEFQRTWVQMCYFGGIEVACFVRSDRIDDPHHAGFTIGFGRGSTSMTNAGSKSGFSG